MAAIFTLWTVIQTAVASVSGLGVAPVDAQTEVTITVDGAVTWTDFAMTGPARIVVDVEGAKNSLQQQRFLGLNRGGVESIRISQYQPDVVRIVIDLARPADYDIVAERGALRIRFANPAGNFEQWRTGGAPASKVATAAAPQQKLAYAPPPDRPEPRITVSFQGTPIEDVVATFAEFSGKSIVIGSTAAANVKVNADIKNQPWDEALHAILEVHGLDARELESGIIRIGKRDELRKLEEQEGLETRQFQIRYVSADSLVHVVRALLTKERGTVTVNRTNNSLVVTDGRTALERIAARIPELDASVPQVDISARIIFIERSAIEELGFTYDLKDSRGNQLNTLVGGFADENGDGRFDSDEATQENIVLLGGNSIAALGNARVPVADPTLQLVSSLVLGRHTLIAFVTALESMSLSEVQARPSVRVLDHRSAEIVVGEETPIRIIDAGASGATGGAAGGGGGGLQLPRATVQLQETGIILRVTPHVSGDQVMLDLHAENSRAVPAVGDAGVTFQKQSSNTQVLVGNGETAVIAGLTVTEKTQVRTGIPFLMDLPVIGLFFRKTADRELKRDLLIMVTPHIVGGV